jgi:hypothetical protein
MWACIGPFTRMCLRKMKLRGVSKEPLSSPKSLFEREVRSISQSFSDSQDRTMAQEKSILRIVTFDF